MIIKIILKNVEKILNRYLSLDPDTSHRLKLLENRVVSVKFDRPKASLYFQFTPEKIILLDDCDGLIDVVLQGAVFDFMRMGLSEKTGTAAMVSNQITISGDVHVAKKFRSLFADLDIDWEEQLSKVTGDVVAHQVGNFVKSLSSWAKKSSDTFQKDMTEYLQEEICLVPTRLELDEFLSDVDVIRDDVERLEARIYHLNKQDED